MNTILEVGELTVYHLVEMESRAGYRRAIEFLPNLTPEILDVEYAQIPMDPFREPPGAEAASKLW